MPELAYVNGTFCDIADAKVSIDDRGFQFADGVYEVIVAHHGRLFRMPEHLERLAKSLDGIGMTFDMAKHRIEDVVLDGVKRSGFDHTMIYLQITRGVAPRSHVVKHEMTPTVVATFRRAPDHSPDHYRTGVSVRTTEEIRWAKCYIKSIALLPNVMAKNDAVRDGYYDAIFVTPDGEVREAAASNLFIIKAGVLRTPPRSEYILHGVTRAYILECAAKAAIPAEETRISRDDLRQADEVFISSTTMDIMPVTRLDDTPVGDGTIGPVTQRLQEQFRRGVQAETTPPPV